MASIAADCAKCELTCVQGADYSYGLGVRTRTCPTEWGLSVDEFGWDGAAGTYMFVEKHLEIKKQIYEDIFR